MDFLTFCRACGVTIDRLPPIGRWVRVPTVDKPRSRNGAVKWSGAFGVCQNWATMTEPAVWKDESDAPDVRKRAQQVARQADIEAREMAARAAQKAAALLAECELCTHPYLEKKGFADELGNVWNREADNILMVPMRSGGKVVGLQQISPEGDKKFLFGQRSGGAEFVIGQGLHVLCEGYATALSARQALRNLKVQASVHVTFSAGNMKRIAASLPGGLVIADNDASRTGQRVAEEIGWPYWMSDVVGEDFNDAHLRLGVFPLAMQLKKIILQHRLRG